MDPDATLRGIRELSKDVRRMVDMGYMPDDHVANALVERVEALDEWLVNGGIVPSAWIKAVDRAAKWRTRN